MGQIKPYTIRIDRVSNGYVLSIRSKGFREKHVFTRSEFALDRAREFMDEKCKKS